MVLYIILHIFAFGAIGGLIGFLFWLLWDKILCKHVDEFSVWEIVYLEVSMILSVVFTLSIMYLGSKAITQHEFEKENVITYSEETINVYSLGNQTEISGEYTHAFFFGTGYVENTMQIYYAAQSEEKGQYIANVPIEQCYFNVTKEQPYVIIRTGTINSWWLKYTNFVTPEYYFFTPENTVRQEYQISLSA